MKGKLLLLALALLFALPSFAQKSRSQGNNDQRRKEFLEIKLDFLAKEIDLKEDQKKQFYDLYSQMETERRAIFKKIKTAEKSIKDNKNASEADYEKATKEIADARAEMSQVDKKYDERFATFLSKKQLFKLKEAENKFMEKARECRDKKKGERRK